MWLFCHFSFERSYDVLKSKSPCILLNKNINFNKKRNGIEIWNSHAQFSRDEPCASILIRIAKLKLKQWWVETREIKRRTFLVPLIFSGGNFFKICFFSLYCALNTLSEYTYFYLSKNITLYTFVACFYPSKHSAWWRRLQDVFSVTYFCLSRCLQDIISRSLHEDVFKKTPCKHVLKTSWKMPWRRLEDVFGRRIANTSWRRIDNVLEDEKLLRWRRL